MHFNELHTNYFLGVTALIQTIWLSILSFYVEEWLGNLYLFRSLNINAWGAKYANARVVEDCVQTTIAEQRG